MLTNKVYKLFASCIPVKGYCRSIIADINRHQLFYIPNSLYNILIENRDKTLKELLEKYGKENESIILEYFDYLYSNELIFPLEKKEVDLFPDISVQWDFPSLCSNAIMDFGEKSCYDFGHALKQLEKVNCFHLQIRFFSIYVKQDIEALLTQTHDYSFRSIHLMLYYDEEIEQSCFCEWCNRFPKLAKIEMFNAPDDKVYPLAGGLSLLILYKSKQFIPSNCGQVSTKYFSIEMNHFMESQFFNTCLNRKVAIDETGKVKNCPTMEKSYGHIDSVNLKRIINTADFQYLWTIKKDDVVVCKECEYRYVCTDCRCYIKNKHNIYSQPSKCAYNPYIAKWEGERGYYPITLT